MGYFIFWFVAGSVILALIPNQMAVLGTTVYLHRTLTHRSLYLRKFVAWYYRFTTWMTTGIVARYWAAVHRKHHAFTDEEPDPHSPYWLGFAKVQWGNVFLYIKACKEEGLLEKYARDIKRDFWDQALFDHPKTGLSLGISLIVLFGFWLNHSGWWLNVGGFWANGLVGSAMGAVGAAIHAFSYVFLQSSSVNGLCHHPHQLGYQHTSEEHAITTYNNLIVALLTGGEGLHHNHHWIQQSARFARTHWELPFDLGWWNIWVMKHLGLAYNVKTAPLQV